MSFLTPGFLLAGVALAAIPIVIHLLNRRRYQTVEWAAMRYLLEAMRKNRRRLRFESLLLLLARCAALFLLALALARPIGCAESSIAALAGSRAGLHVFVLDDSYSMAYEAQRPDAHTHFEQARRLVRLSIVRLDSGSQQVAVIAAGSPARVLVPPTLDLEVAAAAVGSMKQSFAGTDLAGALRLATEIADRDKDVPTRSLTIVSDCTNEALARDTQLAGLARTAAERFRIELYNVGLVNQSNRSVADVGTGEPLVRLGFGADLTAVIRGYGGAPEARVEWKLDDRPLPGGETIRPDANTPALTNSQAAFDRAGTSVAEVSLSGDSDRLKIDDVRRHVVDVVGDVKVLIVEGRRGLGALQGSGSYLRLALAPPSDPAAGPAVGRYVTPTNISDLELAGRPLDPFRAVILAGVGGISADAATSLQHYVEGGGSLILFMGEAVNGDEYNRTLGAKGLLPGTLAQRVKAPGGGQQFTFDFDPTKPHPMLNAFEDIPKSGLEAVQVETYWRVQLDPARRAERVLNFRDSGGASDPAITVQNVGRGRAVFVATGADAEWSTLVAKPAYVTLVHELLGGAVGDVGSAWMNRVVGDVIELPQSLNLTDAPTLRESRDLTSRFTRSDRGDGTMAWRSDTLARPGVYHVEAGKRSWPIAVNLPAAEADVRTLDAAGIRRALGDVALDLRGDSLPDVVAVKGAATDFAWPILAVLLPLLGVESLMASKFSRRRAAA